MPVDRFAVFADGLQNIPDFSALDDEIDRIAAMALNDTATRYRKVIADDIHDQVNFPIGYLKPSTGRLTVKQQATRRRLSSVIAARTAPTSLARFVKGNPRPSARGGVYVEVAPGKARFMKRAFVMKLRAGNAPIETKYNLGLAMRLRPGETIRNKRYAKRVEGNLYLLYGPSVDQVFRANDGSGVAEDRVPDIVDAMEDEFLRLWEQVASQPQRTRRR